MGTAEDPRPAAAGTRPRTARMVAGQVSYANRTFWRTPVAAFFTLAFPLVFLVIIGAVVGNEVIDERNGVRVAQFLTPVFAVFGVVMASFATLAIGVAFARESGVLKRLRGTPLPPWVHLAGRVGSAVWVSLIAVTLLVAVGIVFYDVQIVWAKLLALLVTLAVGIACFAALGLAVTSLVSSPTAVQALTTGVVVPLAFISDIFAVAELPPWLDRVGWLFPLKHFANAVADDFNPYHPGTGFFADHLLVMAAWGLVGLLVALRWFRWVPRAQLTPRAARPSAGVPRQRSAEPVSTTTTAPGRPSRWALVRGQVRYADRATWRDPSSVFFAVAFPVLLVLFFALVYPDARWRGVPLVYRTTPAFAVYGVAVAAYANLPEAVAAARERGVLKRLAGTPLPQWAFVAGRIGSAFWIGGLAALLTFAAGVLVLGVRMPPERLPALVVTFVVGTGCFAALGLAIASVVRSARAVTAVTLGTLLPLAFFSDIFLIGDGLPTVMSVIGDVFPLKHFANAAVQMTDPRGVVWADWGWHLVVMALWGVAGVLVSWRFLGAGFRSSPASGTARTAPPTSR